MAKVQLIGQIIMILSFIWLALFMSGGNIVLIGIALLTSGGGIMLIMIPVYSSSLSSVASTKRGIAGGLLNTFSNTGASFGTAILGAIFVGTQFSNFSSALAKNPDTQNLEPSIFEGLLSGVTTAVNAVKALSSSLQTEIETILKSSYNYGITFANLFAAFVIAVVLVVTFFYFKPKRVGKEEKEAIFREPF